MVMMAVTMVSVMVVVVVIVPVVSANGENLLVVVVFFVGVVAEAHISFLFVFFPFSQEGSLAGSIRQQ